jgi:copper chaperone CopZ
VARVRAALEKVPGVTGVEIDFAKKTAVVKGSGMTAAALEKAVDDAEGGDYKAKVKP